MEKITLSEKLKMLRDETGFTQERTAESIGIPQSSYQSLEAEGAKPSYDTLLKIADYYEVSVDWLMDRTDDRNGPVLLLSECGGYSYLNLLHWDEQLMIELIRGFVIQKLVPPTIHQMVSGNLICQIGNQIDRKSGCEMIGRLGVRPFEKPGDKPEDVDTFLVPDLQIVLDRSKFDKYGCIGAPDMVIEILSPATRRLDLGIKRELYEEAGVTEYWAADPDEKTVQVYILEDGKYRAPLVYTANDTIYVSILEDCRVDLSEVFEDPKWNHKPNTMTPY